MSYTSELYQQVILDHNRSPRNFRSMDHGDHCDGKNPLCGDEITVFIDVDGDVIKDISFHGSGCAISKASSSMMTMAIKGKRVSEARLMFSEFHKMIKDEFDPNKTDNHLGKLKVFMGVREYPSRTKCATLPWHTMVCALNKEGEISTE